MWESPQLRKSGATRAPSTPRPLQLDQGALMRQLPVQPPDTSPQIVRCARIHERKQAPESNRSTFTNVSSTLFISTAGSTAVHSRTTNVYDVLTTTGEHNGTMISVEVDDAATLVSGDSDTLSPNDTWSRTTS
ncbi:MAG: hypothetical protein MHM6MM_007858 [Cercozoa sp. M6MM]